MASKGKAKAGTADSQADAIEPSYATNPLPAVNDTLELPVLSDEVETYSPEDDPSATRPYEAVQLPQQFTPSRLHTLAAATSGPRGASSRPSGSQSLTDSDEVGDAIADEVDEEWDIADQPTIFLTPQSDSLVRPAFLRDDAEGEESIWPARQPARPAPRVTRPAPEVVGGPRYAAPDGRMIAPTPPHGLPKPNLGDPRMERFQALRNSRVAHEQGSRVPGDPQAVADIVRTWWSDLRPSFNKALRYQHEARASGMHPVPATDPTPFTKLGDVFGQLADSARGMASRAQAAAAPTLQVLHEKAEQAAQAIIDRIEGTPIRQQAPFLGPGRIAVLFQPAVKVGQAQRLLLAANAQPLRLIPRKHGFLARVAMGAEAEISERLRQHPYVRDVIYVDYEEDGRR